MQRGWPVLLVLCVALLLAQAAMAQSGGPAPRGDAPATRPSKDAQRSMLTPGPERENPRPMRPGRMDDEEERGNPMRGLTPEQIDEVLQVLREYDPELANQINEWKAKDPQRIGRALMPQMPRLMQMVYLKRHNPEMFQLRVEDFRLYRATELLARQLTDAMTANDKAKTTELQNQIKVKLVEHFNHRQKMREHELEQLEKRMVELRQQIKSRRDSRDALVQARLDELSGKAPKAEW